MPTTGPSATCRTPNRSHSLACADCGLHTCERRKHQDRRQSNPVIEAALDIDRLTNSHRHGLLGYDRLTECGIRRRKQRREQSGFPDREFGKRPCREHGPRQNRQWQTDQQHAHRQRVVAPHAVKVYSRGVGEEHQNQREFCDEMNRRVTGIDIRDTESTISGSEAEYDEDQGRRYDSPLQASRDQRVQEQRAGNDGQSRQIHRSITALANADRACVAMCIILELCSISGET